MNQQKERYHPYKSRKRGLAQAYKAAWADIARAKFSVARPEFICYIITELILNWFF